MFCINGVSSDHTKSSLPAILPCISFPHKYSIPAPIIANYWLSINQKLLCYLSMVEGNLCKNVKTWTYVFILQPSCLQPCQLTASIPGALLELMLEEWIIQCHLLHSLMSCELRPFPGKTVPPLQNHELPRKHEASLSTSTQPCETCHQAVQFADWHDCPK